MKFSLYLSFTVHFISKNISHFRPVSSIRISLPCFYLLISYLRNDAYHSLNLSNNPTRSVCGGGGGGCWAQTECIMGDSIIVNAMLYNTNRLLHFRNQTSGFYLLFCSYRPSVPAPFSPRMEPLPPQLSVATM